MIPKRVLRHAEIPRDINKWKMPPLNLVIFRKNSIFGRNANILLKASNRKVRPKTSREILFRFSREFCDAPRSLGTKRCEKCRLQNLVIFEQKPCTNSLKKSRFWTRYKYSFKSLQSNQCILKRHLRHFLGCQGNFTTRRDPQGHKQLENADFKIWSFLAKNP